MLKVLKFPHIRLLWASQVLSAFGDQLFLLALMWIAVQRVGSAAGIVTAFGSVAALITGLLGGIFADRLNTKITMVSVDVLRAIAVLSLPVSSLLAGVQLWQLILISIIVETLGTLFDPALQISLPILLNNNTLLHATNALMDSTRRIARILGPGMAGFLLVCIPLIHFFTIDAISFFMSALTILLLGKHFVQQPGNSMIQKTEQSKNIITDIQQAFELIRGHRPLLWIFIALFVANVAWGATFIVGVPLLINHVLMKNVGTYGFIVGAYGIGNVVSSIWVGNRTLHHKLRFIYLGRIILATGYLILALSGSVWIALSGAAIASLGGPMAELPLLTMLQTDFPSRHLGKLYSLRMTLSSLGLTCGTLLAAPMYILLNIRFAMIVFPGALLMVGCVCLLRFYKC